jgi:hypothetical protein
MNKCNTCGEEIKPNCDWRQGRCPHLPSMSDLILSDPYKARYLNLFSSIKGWFCRG